MVGLELEGLEVGVWDGFELVGLSVGSDVVGTTVGELDGLEEDGF